MQGAIKVLLHTMPVQSHSLSHGTYHEELVMFAATTGGIDCQPKLTADHNCNVIHCSASNVQLGSPVELLVDHICFAWAKLRSAKQVVANLKL